MFGISSFAQTAFADLPSGGNNYLFSVFENFGADDSSTQQQNLLESIFESITIIDNNSEGDIFIEAITEATIGMADTQTTQFAFLDSITEDSQQLDVESIAAQFAVSDTENFGSGDINTEYFAANDSIIEPIVSVLDSNSQLFAFLDSITENASFSTILGTQSNYLDSITENVNMASIQAIAAQFASSITENSTMADVEVAYNLFFESITENLNSAAIQAIAAQFQEIFAENVNMADYNSQQSAFLETIVENSNLLDILYGNGWIRINDSQFPLWKPINNTQ